MKGIQKHKTAHDLATPPQISTKRKETVCPRETSSTIRVSQTWRGPERPSVRTSGQNVAHAHRGTLPSCTKGRSTATCHLIHEPQPTGHTPCNSINAKCPERYSFSGCFGAGGEINSEMSTKDLIWGL